MEDGDFTPYDLCTPATQVEAEVVFVGYGISAPEKGLDEYADVNVAGKIVLALKGSPLQAEVPRLYFGPEVDENAPNEAWEEEAKDQAKIQLAYDQGGGRDFYWLMKKAKKSLSLAGGDLRVMYPNSIPRMLIGTSWPLALRTESCERF